MSLSSASGDVHELTYHGGSMRSLFREGELMRVRSCGMESVTPGDVIVFRTSDAERNIVHRVIRREGTMLLTRGDDRVTMDEQPVSHDQFIGRVEAVRRNHAWRRIQGGVLGLIRGRVVSTLRLAHVAILKVSRQQQPSGNSATIRDTLQAFYALLAACERGSLSAGSVPDDAATWAAVVTLADRHELAPYLCWNLNHADLLDTIPIESRERLQHLYRQAWVQYQRLFAAQRRISRAFLDRGIDLISLKGMWFAHTLYPDPATRPMTDLDLLVRQEDVAESLAICRELGFERQRADGSVSESKEIWLYDSQRRIKVDLHVDVLPYYADFDWDITSAWSRAQRVEQDGLQLMVLAPEDQLIHLLIHGGVEHLLQPLKVMLDVRLAWKMWGGCLDEQQLRSNVVQAGLKQAFDLTTAVVDSVFGTAGEAGCNEGREVVPSFVRWIRDVGPILNRASILQLYAGRDYLLYARRFLRRLIVSGRERPDQTDGSSSRVTGKRIAYVLRRALSFIGLGGGVVLAAIRFPERKYFTFLRMVLWLTDKRATR